MKRSSSYLAFTIAILTLAGGLGCSAEERPAPPAQAAVRDVQLLPVSRTTVPDFVEVPGTVRAAQSSQLASQIMAVILEICAQEGDRVRRGDVLVVLDPEQTGAGLERAQAAVRGSEQEIAAAEADLRMAETTLRRYQQLYERKSVSPQEYDEVKTRRDAAAARLEMARSSQAQAAATLSQAKTGHGYTRIRAPFDGTVTAKLADAGTLATPGMPIITLENTRRLRLEVTVDESDLALVRLGAAVPVAIDALGKNVSGRTAQIVPVADAGSRSVLVKIELPADIRLHSGFFGRAQFARGQRESMLVPRSAVVERGQLQGVYVVGKDQVASLRYVTLGRAQQQQVEVLSGLDDGERVIAEPGYRELAGRKVEVQR